MYNYEHEVSFGRSYLSLMRCVATRRSPFRKNESDRALMLLRTKITNLGKKFLVKKKKKKKLVNDRVTHVRKIGLT